MVAALPAGAAPLAPTPARIALTGAVSTFEDGVYATEVVVAFEPADAEPEEAKEEDAPGPAAPAEVLVWRYRSWILPGFPLHARRSLQDHVILVQLRIHGIDLALAKGVVEGVVNGGKAQCQAAMR